MERKPLAVDPIDRRGPFQGRKCQTHRAFRQSVYGLHTLLPKPVSLETLTETFDRLGANRLRPVCGDAPGTQVQSLDVLVIDSLETKVVSEVGRRRQGSAVPMNGPQPALGTRQKCQRRHHDELHGMIHAAKPSPDQPHVVIERQPTDEHIRRFDLQGHPHRADVGKQVGVGQRDAFRLPRAARGVLQKGEVLGVQ